MGNHQLVCGGGVGGLAAAHRLRRLLPDSDRIILFDASPVHTFWPSLLWVMTGARDAAQVTRPFADLRERGITVVQEPITAIDPESPAVTAGGRQWTGDAIILALGAVLDATDIPGLGEGGSTFYTAAGAERVWQQLQSLEHGRVVVLISRVPFNVRQRPMRRRC